MRWIAMVSLTVILAASVCDAQDNSPEILVGFGLRGLSNGETFTVGMKRESVGFLASVSHSVDKQHLINVPSIRAAGVSLQFLFRMFGGVYLSGGPIVTVNSLSMADIHGVGNIHLSFLDHLYASVGYSESGGFLTGVMVGF